MKYFVYDNERKNTVYHEFQKGKFDGHTFWKSDSVSLSDDIFCMLGIEELFADVSRNYNPYTPFEIDRVLWDKLKLRAKEIGGELYMCIAEVDEWVKNTYLEYDVFTVIDI